MDLIMRAMGQGLHLCEDESFIDQTWDRFYQKVKNKKLFLFGTGGGMAYFFRYCCNHMRIEGVIDNDPEKQGRDLDWYSAEAYQTEYGALRIQGLDGLKLYDRKEVVVLLTSVDHYRSMAKQLRRLGYEEYFSLLMMEAHERLRDPDGIRKNLRELREEYVDWCCRQPLKLNKIVMRIGEYGGHEKSITRQLVKLKTDLDIVWLVNSSETEAPFGVRLVYEGNWKRYIYELETAGIWVFDLYVPEFIRKRERQVYIQTKHWSSITLKKFGLEDKSSCISPEIEALVRMNGKRADYLFSGSEFDEKSCRAGLAFQGKAVRLGSARSDILFDETVKERVFTRFGLDTDTHVLLYAPTYRHEDWIGNQSLTVTLDLKKVLTTFRNAWGGNWVLFVRLHPWLDFAKSGLTEADDRINVGNYPEGEELVAASDVMITDYSSIMFEAAFLKRPVFLYAPDKEKYLEEERGFLLDYEKLPFPAAGTNEALCDRIVQFDRMKYEKDVADFLNAYGICEDGHAGERAAKFIIELLGGGTK